MEYDILLSLIVFSVVSSVTPGPNNIMLLASGVNYGFTKTIPHIMGIVLGFSFMCLCIGFGLGTLFQLYPQLLGYLKIAALIYIAYLSWQTAFSKALDSGKSKKARPMTFIEAALFQWVNPKAWVMGLTAITLYVSTEHPILSVMIISLVFGLTNIPCQSAWTAFGVALRSFLADPLRLKIFNFTMGTLLILSVIPIFLT